MNNIVDISLRELKRGSSLRVGRAVDGHRRITIEPSFIRKKRNLRISNDDLSQLAVIIADWIASDPRIGNSLETKLDFYGRQWIELRVGWLNRWNIRIALPFEHLDIIRVTVAQGLLAETAAEDQPDFGKRTA